MRSIRRAFRLVSVFPRAPRLSAARRRWRIAVGPALLPLLLTVGPGATHPGQVAAGAADPAGQVAPQDPTAWPGRAHPTDPDAVARPGGHRHHGDAAEPNGPQPRLHGGPAATHHPAGPQSAAVPLVPAAVAAPVPVGRSRWTATADSHADPTARAGNVLDGDPATSWRSTAALPATVTIDMHARVRISGLTYLPPADSAAGGAIEQYRVQLSTDGATWGAPVASGTFAADSALKAVELVPATARYVRLTALRPAGTAGRPVAAAEINLLAAVDPALPRTGWTAAADSHEAVAATLPPANVLDGDTDTSWHSRWTEPADALPNTLLIDMKATNTVTGLSYLPRQDTPASGRIGGYRVEVSTNGAAWGTPVATGTFGGGATAETVAFAAVSARYVRLTALSEVGGAGGASSAAEINILGRRPGPAVGRWSAPITFPLVPAAAALLPNGRLLTWSANKYNSFGGSGQTVTATYHPGSGAVTRRTVTQTGHDMFCSGISALPDGRLLVTGGDDAGKSSHHNATANTWTTGRKMAISRAYHSTTTLSDGRVFAIGGSWNGGRGGKNGEVFAPATGWRKLPRAVVKPMLTADRQGVYRADNHGWLFAWSGGRVLQAGPSRAMNWYGTTGAGSTTAAGRRAGDPDAMNGTAVMYDAGRILTLGGARHYQKAPATANAHVVTIGAGYQVTTRRVAPMRYARAFHNSVVLPDGTVLVLGGQAYPVPFSDNTSVLAPELWNPATEKFTTLAPATVPRNYHSVAVLLPDGRVFSGGGGLCGSCATNHFTGQVFTPPYLLTADGTPRSRPVIASAPSRATHGTAITVRTDRAVSQFSLVRLGSATHTVNTDQRRIRLASVPAPGGYRLSVPASRGVLLPGNYLLFALDPHGVPSVARTLAIR